LSPLCFSYQPQGGAAYGIPEFAVKMKDFSTDERLFNLFASKTGFRSGFSEDGVDL
jgi:hypothetical protein